MNQQPSRSESPDAPTRQSRSHAYYELTKPTIAVYVVIVALVSYRMATGRAWFWLDLVVLTAGLGLATGGILALNQYLERVPDALMKRTRKRPLPSGRLQPGPVLAFSLTLIAAGVGLLWYYFGTMTALLTLGSGLAYDFVYTPLKTKSYIATLVGGLPGATPALVGWSAASDNLSIAAWALFAIAYFWQMPHVLGLAWVLREDYRAAGFHLTPKSDPSGRVIGLHMVAHTAALLPLSLLPTFLGLTGTLYLVGAGLLGIWLLGRCVRAWRSMSTLNARSVFLGSLLYQPALLLLMLIDAWRLS